MTLQKRQLKIIIGVAILAIIAGGIVLSLQNQKPGDVNNNPRTVFWRHIHGLGIDPSDRSILYIATHGDFYQSINGGPPVKVDEKKADYMAFNAPSNAGIPLYASGHPQTGGNMGLVKSTDGGKTWQTVATILDPPVDFHAMSVSKADPSIIIGFDSGGRGLFKTTDAGLSWQKLEPPEYISALAISPTDSNVIFAGTGNGVYQSNDGGNSWRQLAQYRGLLVFALTFDENGTLYASTGEFGLSRSKDLGQNWENIDKPDLTITSIAVDSQNQIIYVSGYSSGGFQEVYSSRDDGKSWDLIATNKEL